jgi:hypothetical protein
VLAYRRFDGEGLRWRLVAAAGVPFLDRLLVLSVPPFTWGTFEISALWGLPLLATAITLGRPPLVPPSAGLLGHPVSRAWFTRQSSPTSWILTVQVPITALCLGVIAAVSLPQNAPPIEGGPPIAVAAVVFAFCVQESLYRLVIQPITAEVWGDRIGMLTTSALLAFTSITALYELVPMGFGVVLAGIAVSLLFGLSTVRGLPIAGVILGRGLFTFCLLCASILQ